MKAIRNPSFDFDAWLVKVNHGKTEVEYTEKKKIFSQGEPADAVFYLQQGKIKLTVVSKQGKEAVLAILGAGSFVGEGCLAGQPVRMASAAAMERCTLVRFQREAMIRLLREEPSFAEAFTQYLLSRTIRVEEDLVDQLFNSSEKRLARILLLLSQFGKEGSPQPIVPKVSQETLAAMVGTTRPRINHFMTKFRKLGFIDYNDTLEVHSSLLSIVLHD
jgi:CRP/FNR family transcriptional regulator, cyclic AMP receptor protein